MTTDRGLASMLQTTVPPIHWRANTVTQEVRPMRSRLLLLTATATLALALSASPVFAGTPAVHVASLPADSMPPLACGTTTFTMTSGEFDYVTRSSETASGNWSMTGTITASRVRAVDGDGNAYSVVGSAHFGFSYNAQTGVVLGYEEGHDFSEGVTTFKLQIVAAGGGSVGSLSFVQHGSPNGTYFFRTAGDCDFA